jgi:hypothetical protein
MGRGHSRTVKGARLVGRWLARASLGVEIKEGQVKGAKNCVVLVCIKPCVLAASGE